MMKWIFTLFLLSSVFMIQAQRELPPVFLTFEQLSVEEVMNVTGFPADSAEKVLQTLEDVRNWTQKRTFSGDVNFGFFGSTTRTGEDNLFNIYGGFNMDWEMYPGNLDFSTLFGITYTDNQLKQNLSAIDVSYDHMHKNVGNGMVLENYIYVNRATNAYLGIDQRYEIGGGFIINNWIKKLVNPANQRMPVRMSSKEEAATWTSWLEAIEPDIERAEKSAFKESYKEGYTKNRIENSKLRTAVLAGLYFELEETTVQDSISLPVTNKFRWVVRPTFDVQLKDGWKMKVRPYFKMPMPWSWNDKVEAADGSSVSTKADYFVSMTAAVSSKLMSKRVEISFIYHLEYDNAPARIYFERSDGGFQLLENNDLNQSFRVAMKVSLDQK